MGTSIRSVQTPPPEPFKTVALGIGGGVPALAELTLRARKRCPVA